MTSHRRRTGQSRKVRVAVLGLGWVGQEVIRHSIESNEVELVGGITFSKDKEGRDLGELAGVAPIGLTCLSTLESALSKTHPDLVIYCGHTNLRSLLMDYLHIIKSGTDVITVAGPMHFEYAIGSRRFAILQSQARASGARMLGIGVNPGFLLDVLPTTLLLIVAHPTRVEARRIVDMRHWGRGAHMRFSIGCEPSDFQTTSFAPLGESVALLRDARGLNIARIDECSRPYIAPTPREFDSLIVKTGSIAGFRSYAHGTGETSVDLEWAGIFALDETVDGVEEGVEIRILSDAGALEMKMNGDELRNSYPATAARAINAVRPLRVLPPGIYRPDQVPMSGS